MRIKAQHWILSSYVNMSKDVDLNYGTPDANFKLIIKIYDTEDDALLQDDEIFVETLYLSNEPAQKGWCSASTDSYLPPVPLGSIVPSVGIARVLKSNSEKFVEGDYVTSRDVGWTTHNVMKATGPMTIKLDASLVPHIVKYISAFGITTLTAYFTAFDLSGVKLEDEGKVWLITGAAGGVGSNMINIVSYLFKPKKILAVAGGEDKRRWVETLGPKVIGLDYKSEDYELDFVKALDGDQIDVFDDQVGGWILNDAVRHMAVHGKIIQVGSISSFANDKHFDFSNYGQVIAKRLNIQGMVLIDHLHKIPEAHTALGKWFATGKLDIMKFTETIVDAKGNNFQKVPELWSGLFKGVNKGKYVTQVAEYSP